MVNIISADDLTPALRGVYDSDDLQSRDQLGKLIEDARLAYEDDMTGLPNNRAFLYDMQTEVDKGSPFAVLALDIDGFKGLNTKYGHPAVNEGLRRFGRAFRQHDPNRLRDSIYRLHGDEFGALLRDANIPNWNEFKGRAYQIQQTISGIYVVSGSVPERTYLRVSIGGSVYGVDGYDVATLHTVADDRLGAVKENGKSGIIGPN